MSDDDFIKFEPQYRCNPPIKNAKGIDFAVWVTSNDKKIATIYVECKAGKNYREGIEQLDRFNKHEKCEYQILVASQYEKTRDLQVKQVQNCKLFIIKPYYFGHLVKIIKLLELQYRKIINNLKTKDLEIKEKAQIIEEAEKIKNDFFKKKGTFSSIKTNLDSIWKQSETISTANQTLKKACARIQERHLKALEKKVISLFSIEKIINLLKK